ncbi:hypothetical protein BS47DRAFT_1391326 [Hydnum rufescens UP504]|uniref:Uncharacterized protein n=1 Tax=Hydnum rufescens UP504 TaxID=1448309 RepID=A0A9P6DUR9_9AGAM|nr:hypothetical protein BS47DRAFT_1391326 [Hydnum rufescens UP504]
MLLALPSPRVQSRHDHLPTVHPHRWYTTAFGPVPLQLATMIVALLCSNSNHVTVTYRFGKAIIPKAYLSPSSMAVIMENYFKVGVVVELASRPSGTGRFALLIDRERVAQSQGLRHIPDLEHMEAKFPRHRTKGTISWPHSQPMTLALQIARGQHGPVELAYSQTQILKQELGQEIVADPCSSNGDLVHRRSDRIWADLFDTVDSLGKVLSKLCIPDKPEPLLRIYYVQKEWTLVVLKYQQHFQFWASQHPIWGMPPHNQALLPKPTKWPLRPRGTLEPPRLHSLGKYARSLDPLSSLYLITSSLIASLCLRNVLNE